MFDKDRVLACAQSLVGFRQDNNPIYATLDPSLQASTSGLYFNDLTSVTFENIDAALTEDKDANQYLLDVYEGELLNLVNVFVNRSKQHYESKELLANQTIVKGVASMNNRITQNGRFVGFLIRPHQSNNLHIQIKELGVQSDAVQATPLRIFLYETSQLEAIATFDFTIDKELSLVWREVSDFILTYQSKTGGTGQEFLLGYYEKDTSNPQDYQLQGQGLFLQFDCGCPGSPKSIYGKYMGIQPIEINNNLLNWNGSSYDIPIVDELEDYCTDHTYGLNAKVNVTCDITDVLCCNIDIFAVALQHAVGKKILLDAYASNRINPISDSNRNKAKDFAMKYDALLNGYIGEDGKKIKGYIDTLTVDFSALDHYCLPCLPGIEKHTLVRP